MTRRSARIIFASAAAAFLVMFFAVYAFLPIFAPDVPNSPDEMANAYFSRLFAVRGELWSFEPLNLIADGRVHPRSVVVADGFLVPGGFIGLPVIYGSVAKAFGTAVIPFLTPLVAVIAAVAWGFLVARAASRGAGDARAAGIGWLSGVLLLSQPAWWYSASRTMMPNTLFTALAVLSAAVLVLRPVRWALTRPATGRMTRLLIADPLLGGVLFSLAAAVRPAELYWLAPCLVIAAFLLRRHIGPKDVIAFAAGAALTMVPFAVLNRSAYGSFFSTGYGGGVSAPGIAMGGGLGARLLGPVGPYLFPLGFAPRTALRNFGTYGIGLFWWWGAVFTAAAGFLIGRRLRSRGPVTGGMRVLAAVGAYMTVWLVLFYGSYAARDNPDPAAVTIGSSYIRYWLPLFVLSTVPVAAAIVHTAGTFAPRMRPQVVGAVVAALAVASGITVFTAPQEGLLAVRTNLMRYDAETRDVIARTGADAVIVTDRADKLLFPARRVVQPLRDDGTYAVLPALARSGPLYYYGITLPPEDLAYLREERLPALGLTMNPVSSYAEETLYRFSPVSTPE